ncbi:uncharacterized protein LOC135838944 isoform X2 [Planococcus citri]|uniref:uncharacterized protein LOC135838944 isoform X2 n=1 Tax=Planococcus citri TaxID=170843 RepID=UPI0031F8556D
MWGIKNSSKVTRFLTPETKIGRNKSNHVVLSMKCLKISRFHAVIRFIDNIPFIKDVSVAETSEWGVFINKVAILKHRWCELKLGDIVAFGAPTVEEKGCITEIVDVDPEENNQPADLSDIPTQAPAPMPVASNSQETIFDLTADEIVNEEPIPPSPAKHKDASVCILSSDEDDEVIFSSPTRLTVEFTPKEKEPKTMIDITSTMNGLLKPPVIMPPPPAPAPVTPPRPPSDCIENQLAVAVGQTESQNSSPMLYEDVKPVKSLIKQEFFEDTQELRNVLNYSMPDEIISLDSDEEDFPSSQLLNTSQVMDIPDYSSTFSLMYELKSEVPSDDEDIKFICSDAWYGPLSQTTEDVKPGLSKGSRKFDPVLENADDTSLDMEVSLDEVDESSLEKTVDASHDEIDNVGSPFVPIASSSKPLEKQRNEPRKIAVISPQPRPKKRRPGDGDEYKKKRKHSRESSDSVREQLPITERSSKTKSPSRKHSSGQSSSSSSKKEKREKIKELYKDRPAQPEKVVREHKVTPKVKKTDKNRGFFLTELDTSSSVSASSSSPSGTANKIGTEVEPSTSSKIVESKLEPGGVDKERCKSESDDNVVTKERAESVLKREIPLSLKITTVPSGNNSSKIAFSPTADMSSLKTLLPKLPIISSLKIAGKSILKKPVATKSMYQKENHHSGRSKKVKFADKIISGCKEIDVDYEVSNISQYKKYEILIRKCSIEFDQALTTVLSWNVKWLQEQQKHVEPPPLYPAVYQNNSVSDAVEKYKEELKYSMFHLIWKNIFANWNMPNNDDFPSTQVPGGRPASNCYVFEIQKCEGSSKDSQISLFTIYAKRELLFFEAPDPAICVGKLAIMNFAVIKPPSESIIKTMAFAYIQSYNRCTDEGRVFDQVVLKIYAKPFRIVPGEVRLKVLNYARQLLKQFQALGMTRSCPIIKPMCDVNFHDYLNSTNIGESKSKPVRFARLLDPAQKKAVITSLNCFTKDSSLSIVDGPCGTGKTQVIVSTLHELFGSNENKDAKVLVITVNDKLADDLVYRMCKDTFDKNVLRFGFCGGLNNSVKHCALDSKIEEILKNEGKDLINIEDEIKILRALSNKLSTEEKLLAEGNPLAEGKKSTERKRKLEDLNGRMRQCEREIEQLGHENSKMVSHMKFQIAKGKAIDAANVVVTSFGTCWSSNFENNFVPNNSNKGDINEFKICIIDDANFLDENSMLIPQLLQVKHLILVGDRKVRSYPNGPYHKILHYFNLNNKDFITNLDEDHRMFPEVSQWVREYFNLNTDLKVPIRKRRIKLKPFLIIDHISSQVVNYQAVLCEKLAKCILDLDSEKMNFGVSVMVPTNLDKENLRSMLNTSNIQSRIRVDFFDGFSTRENDVIVLCLPASKIFDEWLYIALTRAKMTLIICGDFEAIEAAPSIVSLLNYAKKEKIYFPLKANADQISSEELKGILAL